MTIKKLLVAVGRAASTESESQKADCKWWRSERMVSGSNYCRLNCSRSTTVDSLEFFCFVFLAYKLFEGKDQVLHFYNLHSLQQSAECNRDSVNSH